MKPQIIIGKDLSTEELRIFDSIDGAAKFVGVNKSSVSRAVDEGRSCKGWLFSRKVRVLLCEVEGSLELCVIRNRRLVSKGGRVVSPDSVWDVSESFYKYGGMKREWILESGIEDLEEKINKIYEKICE